MPSRKRNSKNSLRLFSNFLIRHPFWVSIIFTGGVLLFSFIAPGFIHNSRISNSVIVLSYWFSGYILLVGLYGLFSRILRRNLLNSQKDLQAISKLSWQEFENLVCDIYRKQGYKVQEFGGPRADGGIDAKIWKNGKIGIVQCKHWKRTSISVSLIREHYGVLMSESAQEGKFITLGDFTRSAKTFAANKPIELITGIQLVAMLRSIQKSSS